MSLPDNQAHSPRENRGVAVHVLGTPAPELQPARDFELRTLQDGLLHQLHYLDTAETRSLVQTVIVDCVRRGLEEGQTALGSHEIVSPAFTRGLRARAAIRNDYREAIDTYFPLACLTDEEVNLQDTPHISPYFQSLEEHLPLVRERFAAVQAFHEALFSIPQLQSTADALRPIAIAQLDNTQPTREREIFLANNRLFANFIVAAGLRQTANLALQPKDIVDLAALWRQPDAREAIKTRVISSIGNVAERLGVQKAHVEAYTTATLEEMDTFFAPHEQTGITEADLAHSPFVMAPEQQVVRRQELTTKDLTHARQAFDRLNTSVARRSGLVRAVDARGISPLDLYFIFHHLVQDNVTFNIRGLKENVPLKKWIAALDLLQANQYREIETGQEIPEFESTIRENVYDTLKYHTLELIAAGELDADMPYVDTLRALPSPVLFEFLGLYPQEREDIYALGDETWVAIARRAGISIDQSGEFMIPPGSSLFEDYFTHMPPGLKRDVTSRLGNILE